MSNMYMGVQTCNPLAGECMFRCAYCSTNSLRKRLPRLRVKYSGPARIDEAALKRLPRMRGTVFVVAQNDLYHYGVSAHTRAPILHAITGPRDGVSYMLQTKNPEALHDDLGDDPGAYPACWFGTTVETDHSTAGISAAPHPMRRIKNISFMKLAGYRTYITIEPVMAFTGAFADKIIYANPDLVYIGADSKRSGLPEPTAADIRALILRLRAAGLTVIQKPNLKRLGGVSDGQTILE